MVPSLLDTNTVSDIIRPPAKRSPVVTAHASAYLQAHGRFSFSELSCYEILRGLRKKGATGQLAHFARFRQPADQKPISMEILDSAASLWVESQRIGRIVGDCDLIIAATAQFSGLGLVTSNTRHFDWIRGLQLFDWRRP
jgi:tRNA(fMet)-specific endonuclease VapC